MPIIEGLNYVESNIQVELLELPTANNTGNATLVIGTARKGRNGVITKVTKRDAVNLFGNAPLGTDFDTNITHAVNGILSSTAGQDKEIYAYKIGNAKKARIDLYENQVFITGDKSFSFDDDTNPIISFSVEARQESEIDNQTSVIVRGDNSGLPASVTITLPDGYRRTFAVDPYGVRTGVARNVRELVTSINADETINAGYVTSFSPLRKTNLEVTVQTDGVTPYIDIPSPTISGSWGDKLEAIESLTELVTQTDKVSAGDTTATLTYRPDKDINLPTPTITSFRKYVVDETLKTVSALNFGDFGDIGQTSFSKVMALSSPAFAWDQNDGTVAITEVRHVRGNLITVIDPGDYSFAGGSITVTVPALAAGDKVEIDYNFVAALEEAKVKSELVIGNENYYFVAGKQITFGAAPSLDIDVTYDAIKEFVPNDLNLADRDNIVIQFIDPDNAPVAGSSVFITFTYLPELPAPTGYALQKSDTSSFGLQKSALQGGTSGSILSKQDYKRLVEEALDETVRTPFRRIVVAGAFLDDSVDGINEETGMPDKVALNWGDLLARKLDLKSRITQECHTILGVTPISTALLNRGEKGVNEWYNYLLTDTDDPYSAATAISALDDYHVDVALGVLLCSDSSILNGVPYVENPAYVVCGMQLDSSLERSLIKSQVPPFVKEPLVKFPSGEIVGKLNTAHYTTIGVNPRGEIRVMDAPAATDQRKNISRQLVRDTVFAVLKIARDIADQFIGERRDQQNLKLMNDKVNRGVIETFVRNTRLLSNFRAEIVPVPGGHITGDTKMRLFIETAREISRVELVTQVKLSGEEL